MGRQQRAIAKLPLIIFGDGMSAQLLKLTPGMPNKDGVIFDEVRMRPTESMFYFYGLSEDQMDRKDFSITRKYPAEMIQVVNKDPSFGRVLILCDFYGKQTESQKVHQHLINTIEGLQKQNFMLKGENAYLHQEAKKKTSQTATYIRELAETVKPILSMAKTEEQQGSSFDPNQGAY